MSSLPPFDVALEPPDLTPWRSGNTGMPGVHSFAAAAPGRHVALTALVHGNEIAGAIALADLLRAGLRPDHGRLTMIFFNLAAFDRFDAAQPTSSRFIDEDFNRLWDDDVLDSPRRSLELDRARALRPIIDDVDILLDLHSMLWPSEPLLLSGGTGRGRDLAFGMGFPGLVVADRGHASGRRLIDYRHFAESDATAVIVEAGQHWQPDTVVTMHATIAAFLRHTGTADMAAPATPPQAPSRRYAEVTLAVTAATGGFTFVRDWHGGEVVPKRDTLIALDGATEIRTPHDDCLLVMPSLRPSRGHTAVRLARFVQ